jgi:hypothetical protein
MTEARRSGLLESLLAWLREKPFQAVVSGFSARRLERRNRFLKQLLPVLIETGSEQVTMFESK